MINKISRSAKIRAAVFTLGLMVMLLPFQNCILFSMVGKSADLASSSGAAPGAGGISPTAVQISWTGVATSTSYNVYNLNMGSQPVATTVFTTARIANLQPGTDYSFSVRGSRGTGQYLTDSLGTYSFTSWPLFTNVAFSVAAETDSSQTISWAYAPWDTSNLAASDDARRGSRLTCAFVPVPANTDPMTLNPTSPAPGVNPLTISGPLFAQKLNLALGTIDSSLTYAAQCTANFVDDTHYPSTQNFLVNPSHLLNPCVATALVGTSYSCSPNLRIPSTNQATTFTLALAETNTCTWAKVVATNIQSNGTLTAANRGTCTLAYRYTVAALDYQSPIINQNVTITVPESFHAFPSFAVRAMSGALAFPHLYSQLTASPDVRAQLHSDLISDFGAGSSFFAGGSTPFPTFNYQAPAMTSTFFYGFPVAAVQGSTRPTGYSLDAIRPTWQSTAPALEGFMRGNLVIPKVSVTNPAFLTATGVSVGPSLFDFLTNRYTFDGGANYSPAPLSYYLNTISDRDVSGDPVSNAWNGIVIEQPTVTFNLPAARAIAAFIPPNGIKGSNVVFGNADATKTVTGLVTASANNSLFYVTNCQNSPSTYANATACTPPTGTPIPTSISCVGDVVINAPVLLVNPTFITDTNGCRIYATGTVFVQGSITVLNQDGTANSNAMQILSSRAVVFGFSLASLGVNNSGVRTANGGGLIDQAFANGSVNPYLTSVANGPGAASAVLNSIALDAQVVNLKPNDAVDPYATGSQTYNHLAVAAPYVFSNYAGIMSGSLIAEVAAFPFLAFDADPALIGITPFPLFTGASAPLTVQGQ